MLSASELTSKNLRRLIQVEEAAPLAALNEAEDLPAMVSLRSPTTRTIIAIHQNNNAAERMREFLLEAEGVRDEYHDLVDEAESMIADPILAPPRDVGDLSVSASLALRSPTARATTPGHAQPALSGLGSPTEPTDRPTAHDDDESLVRKIVFSYPRDAAGQIVDPDKGITAAGERRIMAERDRANRSPDLAATDAIDAPIEQLAAPERPLPRHFGRPEDDTVAALSLDATGRRSPLEMPEALAEVSDAPISSEVTVAQGSAGESASLRPAPALGSGSHATPALPLRELLAQQQQELADATASHATYTKHFARALDMQRELRRDLHSLLDPAAVPQQLPSHVVTRPTQASPSSSSAPATE